MIRMKVKLLVFLPFLLFAAGAFVSCEEVEEEGKYSNWQELNEVFLDSIKVLAGDRLVGNLEQLERIQEGEMFYIKNDYISTSATPEYIYCKKLRKNLDGDRPLYFGSAYVHYYGTLIDGTRFDGTFDGYGATDRNIPAKLEKEPTAFDTPVLFNIGSSSLTSGWRQFLQYMHSGERWIVYVPWGSAYGTSGNQNIPGYSVLTFDVIMTEVVPL